MDPDCVQNALGKTNGLKFLRLWITLRLRLEQGPSSPTRHRGNVSEAQIQVCMELPESKKLEFVKVRSVRQYWEIARKQAWMQVLTGWLSPMLQASPSPGPRYLALQRDQHIQHCTLKHKAFSIRSLAQSFKLVPMAVASGYRLWFAQPPVEEKQRWKLKSPISNKSSWIWGCQEALFRLLLWHGN